MGYMWSGASIAEFQERKRSLSASPMRAGLRESHVHDVAITRESPNYPTGV